MDDVPPMTGKQIDILLVEDDASDIELTQEALSESKLALRLHIVTDGEQALEFLRRQGRYAAAPRPDLMILDLNLPRIDGREVLKEVKGDSDLRSIPVCVVTTSDAEVDVLKSYGLGANCYVTKPLGLDQFVRVIRAIEDFWLTIVKLPSSEVAGIRPPWPQAHPTDGRYPPPPL